MVNILVIGAGKSSHELVRYLNHYAENHLSVIKVADSDFLAMQKKFASFSHITLVELNLNHQEATSLLIAQSDIVISLAPPPFHPFIAQCCVWHKKNMVTASYLSEAMKKLHQEALNAGVILLNEAGLDPGIDHISAMYLIEKIKAQGGTIDAFESFTGGLLSPDCEKDNPWKYKFTWNPKNVISAGQGVCKFIQEGKYKYIPYHRLFRRTEIIAIENFGLFEGYGNRDALQYREFYGLENIKTIYRGTLRRPGFCKSWDTFIQLGMTDDSYSMENVSDMTYREFTNSFLYYHPSDSVELKLAHYMHFDIESEEMYRLKWLGIFDNHQKIGLQKGSPAEILLKILENKWQLDEDDKDMIVMWHKFNYTLKDKKYELQSSMVHLGENLHYTAMAKTVGIPLAIATQLILEQKIKSKGVCIPVIPEIYNQILPELKKQNIYFKESLKELN